MKDGFLLANRYEIIRCLGVGGMAKVYLAKDKRDGRELAIKCMNLSSSRTSTDEEIWSKRFHREFNACASLQHENVIRLFELGTYHDDRLYYTMEYLPFADLDQVVKRSSALPLKVVFQVVRQLAAALVAIHEAGLVHRDLKPSNLIMTQEQRLVVMDFGLVRSDTVTKMTKTGSMMGTPRYAAPEQFLGTPVDGRADIHAFGAITYFLLTGSFLFDAENLQGIIHEIVEQPPPLLSSKRDGLDLGWQLLLDGCLAKNPDDRYASAKDLLGDVQKIGISSQEIGASLRDVPIPSPSPSPSLPSPSPSLPSLSSTYFPSNSRYFYFLAALLLLTLSLGLLKAFVFEASPKTYSIQKLRVIPKVGSFELHWESEELYPSRLAELTPSKGRVEGEDGLPTRKHKLRILGLADGTRYSFRLLFPSGDCSLPKTVTTSNFDLKIFGAVLEKDKLEIRFRAPGAIHARICHSGSLQAYQGRPDDHEVWCFSLPPNIDFNQLQVRFDLGGEYRKFHLKSLLAKTVASLAKSLDRLRLDPLAKGVVLALSRKFSRNFRKIFGKKKDKETQSTKSREMKEQIRFKTGVKKVRELTHERLTQMGVIKAYKQALGIAHLVFDYKTLPIHDRLLFHERMRRFETMHLYFDVREAPVLFLPFPNMGSWSLRRKISPGSWTEQVLFRRKDQVSKSLGVMHSLRKSDAVSSWDLRFTIKETQNIKEAELFFKLALNPDYCAQIAINECFRASIYGEPTLHRKPREPLIQGFPPEVLRNGENHLRISMKPILDNIVRKRIRFYEIVLRVRN